MATTTTASPWFTVSPWDTLHDEPSTTDPELKLPQLPSLVIIITSNLLIQISFFIIVSSSNDYAIYLGGNSTFSGVVIGIPTVFAAIAVVPLLKYDGGGYKLPLHVSCAASIVGLLLYALAYPLHYLYLILLGRIVNGIGFSMWMYHKRYCADPRIVGIRRRTTLASWLVMGQGAGMTLGPFLGGLLYKEVGFANRWFNGFTSPAWIMVGVWMVFWAAVQKWYKDPVDEQPRAGNNPVEQAAEDIPMTVMSSAEKTPSEAMSHPSLASRHHPVPAPPVPSISPPARQRLSSSQLAVSVCMCWFAMTCFFILGAWEANMPVFGSSSVSNLHWTPFSSGNYIALGGLTTFPFLLLNVIYARRYQDRITLAVGSALGMASLIVFIALLEARDDRVHSAAVVACWWAVALGFNLASTVTLSLLSKQTPGDWNNWTSLAIQYSNFTGRVTGAIWGGSGVAVGMANYVGLEIALVGIGGVLFTSFWKDLKAKVG
ncbi:MFS general substrate transporter [Armillaria gallica]|uniref:MFS general substrate transporter n=1 Tax=Armillaria gallica TaxID=47427 RepID=A0A2H3EVH1_ARMGA|nr:MFS general substrate transporter [Armillaria gallica]